MIPRPRCKDFLGETDQATWTVQGRLELAWIVRVGGRASYATIARWMGVTKNAVAGQIHRLGLSRPRRGTTRRSTSQRMQEHGCTYPIGDPKAHDFRFCGKPIAGAAPYCEHHRAICFRRTRPIEIRQFMKVLRL